MHSIRIKKWFGFKELRHTTQHPLLQNGNNNKTIRWIFFYSYIFHNVNALFFVEWTKRKKKNVGVEKRNIITHGSLKVCILDYWHLFSFFFGLEKNNIKTLACIVYDTYFWFERKFGFLYATNIELLHIIVLIA